MSQLNAPMRPAPSSSPAADWLIMAAANFWAYLRHPLLALIGAFRLGQLVNFARPRDFNELVQWRKMFDHDPAFATYVDKLAVKGHVQRLCPELNVAEVVWSGTDVAALPAQFISPGYAIKVNNGCAQNYMPHRGLWPAEVLERRARRWLGRRWARLGEWAYAQVTPRLFVERLIGGSAPLVDLNLRAFNGKVAFGFVALDWKTPEARCGYLGADGRQLDLVSEEGGRLPADFALPAEVMARAIGLAETLSRGIDHVRVDFLIAGDAIWFCEMTLYTSSGYGDERELGTSEGLARLWFENIECSQFLRRSATWPLSLYQAAFRRWAAQQARDLDRLALRAASRSEEKIGQ